MDLLPASYGDADKEFVSGTRIDMTAQMPVKTLRKFEWVRDDPDSESRRVEAPWIDVDDKLLTSQMDKWEQKFSRLEDQRGRLLTLLEDSISSDLSSELLSRNQARMDEIIWERDTLG
jgi:hypothetical protein